AERSVEPPALMPYASSEDWIARIGRLQDALSICPTDILARSELATLLEQLGQPEEALFNWNAVLACDPNSLAAREGVARCRQRTGWPLQSAL
ncbi:MAG: tetratricopeptide repeat protein, partial [Nitrospirota bacterium]